MKKRKSVVECIASNDALKEMKLSLIKSNDKLFNQNPASMAIRRISDNMMLNANNSF
jgi:hypothetical protein